MSTCECKANQYLNLRYRLDVFLRLIATAGNLQHRLAHSGKPKNTGNSASDQSVGRIAGRTTTGDDSPRFFASW